MEEYIGNMSARDDLPRETHQGGGGARTVVHCMYHRQIEEVVDIGKGYQ